MKKDVELQAFANEVSVDGDTGPTGGLGKVMSQSCVKLLVSL